MIFIEILIEDQFDSSAMLFTTVVRKQLALTNAKKNTIFRRHLYWTNKNLFNLPKLW